MSSSHLKAIEFGYKNWRGEVSKRRARIIRLEFKATEQHPEPCWILVAFCVDKNAERDFKLEDCTFSDSLGCLKARLR